MRLTRMPRKRELYARETYFREAWRDANAVLEQRTLALLHNTALLMIKPDGLAAGKAAPILAFLAEQAFTTVAVEALTFNRFLWRELWRYQLTIATVDRLAVSELVLQGDALLLLLQRESEHTMPASVRLSGLKGSASLAHQDPSSLRYRLQQPNRLLSFLHVADEPIDVVRELGLLLDQHTRKHVYRALSAGCSSAQAATCLDAVLQANRGNAAVFDVEGAVGRLAQALALAPAVPANARTHAFAALDQINRGQTIDFDALTSALALLRINLPRWDLVAIGARFTLHDEAGQVKWIDAVDRGLWE